MRVVGPCGWIAFAVIATILLGSVFWSVFTDSGARWIIGPLVIAYLAWAVVATMRSIRMKKERADESICTFALELPARDHDTWVVRAVYEELSKDRSISIRPSDRLEQDLGFLPEDLDDIVIEIARRAGRSINHSFGNPNSDRLTTVEDLVAFLELQPRKNQTAQQERV